MCAMHVVAALAGGAEGSQAGGAAARLEAVLVQELVQDLQRIMSTHMFVSVSCGVHVCARVACDQGITP